MLHFKIYGSVSETDTYFCESIARKIAAKVPDCTVDMEVMFEVDYLLKIHELTKQNCMLMYHKQTHLVLRNGEVVGNAKAFVEMAMKEYDVADAEAANTVIYNRFVRELTAKLMKERGRPIVYIEFVDAGSKPSDAVRLGVMQIELFNELCPQAVENFTKLCMGMGSGANAVHYKGCPIHRLVKDGWIQCGDMVDGSGAHSTAALDQTGVVPDESFTLDFGFIPGGIVGFANEGAHSSGSQFFITMGPCEWMNHNFVGVGRVLQGFHVLRALNQLATANQRPIKNITVLSCGITPIE